MPVILRPQPGTTHPTRSWLSAGSSQAARVTGWMVEACGGYSFPGWASRCQERVAVLCGQAGNCNDIDLGPRLDAQQTRVPAPRWAGASSAPSTYDRPPRCWHGGRSREVLEVSRVALSGHSIRVLVRGPPWLRVCCTRHDLPRTSPPLRLHTKPGAVATRVRAWLAKANIETALVPQLTQATRSDGLPFWVSLPATCT